MLKIIRFLPFIVLNFLSFQLHAFEARHSINQMVAVVNGEMITTSELNAAHQQILNQLKVSKVPIPPDNILRKQVLRHLILNHIQWQLAKQHHIVVTDEMIDQGLRNIAKSNHTTVAQLRKKVEASGMSYSAYRKILRKQMMIQHLQSQLIASHIKVSKKEIQEEVKRLKTHREANNEYHLATILVALPEVPSSDQVQGAERRSDAILKKLKSGVSFKKLAIAESAASNALKGGDFGWHKLSELPSVYVKHLRHMKVGEVSDAIRAPNGFHIVKIMNQRAHPIDSKHLEKQARRNLFTRKMNEALQKWFQKIEEGAYIETF